MKRKLSGAGVLWLVFCGLGMSASPAYAQGFGFGDDLVAAAFQDPPPKVSGQMFLNSVVVAKDTVSAGMQSVDLSRPLRGFEDVAVQIAIRPYAKADAIQDLADRNPEALVKDDVVWNDAFSMAKHLEGRQGRFFLPFILDPSMRSDVLLKIATPSDPGDYLVVCRAVYRKNNDTLLVWEIGRSPLTLVAREKFSQAGPESQPRLKGRIQLDKSKVEAGEILRGRVEVEIGGLSTQADAILRLSAYKSTGVRWDNPGWEWPIYGVTNGTYAVELGRDLSIVLPEDGEYFLEANLQLSAYAAGLPDGPDSKPTLPAGLFFPAVLAKVPVSVHTEKSLTLARSEIVGGPTAAEGQGVEFRYQFNARGIQGQIAEDVELQRQEDGTGQPAAWIPVKKTDQRLHEMESVSRPQEFPSSTVFRGMKAGRYRVAYNVKAVKMPDIAPLAGALEFTVGNPAPTAGVTVASAAGPVYVQIGVQEDTDKRAGRVANGVFWQSINRSGASGYAEANPKTRLSVSVGGSPPEILKPGVKFDITISVQGSAKEGDDFSVSAGLSANGVDIVYDPPDRENNRIAAWGHAVNGKYMKVNADKMICHCTVTSNSLELSGGDAWIVPFVSGTGPMAMYLYRLQTTPSNAPPAAEATVVTAEVVPPPARTNQIRARLLKPAITLVPGEMPEHCGVYISGFRDNTEDQVQIRVPLLGDMWGSLRQNPDIRVDGGDWNEAPDYMYGDEHYVLMSWQSRFLAKPATAVVPITVRQNGAGEVVLPLRVTIAPRPVVPGVGNKPPFRGPPFQPPRPPVVMMSLDQLYARALQCLEHKEYAKAETILRELVRREPKKAAYLFARGRAWEGQEKWQEAVASFGEAVRLEDNNVEYRVHLGNAWLALGQPKQVEKVYREGIQLQPNLAMLHFGLGGALAVQQRWADAETPHREAVRLEPANSEYQFRLAIDYAFQGKAAQEEACVREAVRLNPGNAMYRDALGSALFRLGRWAESEAAYRQAIGIDGNNGTYHANLAGALLKQQRRGEALREAETAQKLGCVGHSVFQELGLPSPGR